MASAWKVGMGALLFILCCLAWTASADYYDYHPYYNWDPTYDGEWEIHYGCWAPAVPGLSVFHCPMEVDNMDYTFGCCLHFNETGNSKLSLTCAYEGQVCLDGGEYVTGNKTTEQVRPYWLTTADPWTYGGSTVVIDEPGSSKGGVNPVTVIVCMVAGILGLGVAVICCCKCSAWCNKSRPDDLVSLVSQDDIPAARPRPRIIRPMKAGVTKSVYIGVQRIEVVERSAGPPSYEDVEKENSTQTTLPPPV